MRNMLLAAACAALFVGAPALALSASSPTSPPATSPSPNTTSTGCSPGQVLQPNGQPCPAASSSSAQAPNGSSPTTPPVTPRSPSTAQAPSPTTPGAQSPSAGQRTAAANFVERQAENQFLASNVMGRTVQDPSGDRIGTVKDIMFDAQGKLAAVVIGHGGFLGIGERSVALPFDMIKTNKDNNGNLTVVAQIDKATLASAPEFMTLEDMKARTPSTPSSGTSPSGTSPSPANPAPRP